MRWLHNIRYRDPDGNVTWSMFRRVGTCERHARVTYTVEAATDANGRASIARFIRLERARLRRDIQAQRKAMLR